MQKKAKSEIESQSFKSLVPMRFRMSPKILPAAHRQNPLAPAQQPAQEELGLSFCEKVSEEHLLIGNQYQLSLLDFSHAQKDYCQLTSLWSLQHSEKISAVLLPPKTHKIFVVCHSRVRCYGYKPDFLESAPLFHFQLSFASKIDSLYCPRTDTLLVLAGDEATVFQMYYHNDVFKVSKTVTRVYKKQRKDLCFLAVPHNQGQNVTVFFQTVSSSTHHDRRITIEHIYSLQLKLNNFKDMEVSDLSDYCQIATQTTNEPFKLMHYKNGIFLFLKGCELFAIRNSYVIEKIKLSYAKVGSFASFASKELLLCYEAGSLDLYQLTLNETRKPQVLSLKCINTTIFDPPKDSSCFAIEQLGGRLIAIFDQKKCGSEFRYWVGICHHADRKEKLRQIFGENKGAREEQLLLAEKIGIERNEAYLEIWNRCGKTSKRDYELLIATQDYDMIQHEIEKKFKKNALRFHEIMFILRSTLEMLHQKVRQNCSAQAVRQLSLCHFLCCKVQMFEKEQRQTLAQGQDICISIQDYYYLLDIQLSKQLIDLLGQLCVERKPVKLKIRALLTQFSMIFRLLYHELLPKIVRTLRQHFCTLISELPEILPIPQDQASENDLTSGPWAELNLQSPNDYLILSEYCSFQTQHYFSEFTSSKFFKVYQWHSHAAIDLSKKQFQAALKANDDNRIFTLLFQTLYEERGKIGEGNLRKIVDKLQGYELLPERLRGKFYFYCKLYQNFKDYFLSEKRTFLSTSEFFSLPEDQLFLLYFKKERAKKGIFILKEIKPIYEQFALSGAHLFNKNMFHFFKTQDSSWSDLKIILNKFNNEKKDFHQANYSIFEVIVRGLMEKIYIGTDSPSEISLEEVIAYLQNIPFPLQQGPLLDNLYLITQIYQQQPLLKALKINMNLRGLLQRGEEVIFRIVQHQIQRNGVRLVDSQGELLMLAYKVLAEVGQKQTKIYIDRHLSFVFKSFLLILMTDQKFITLCRPLLSDDFIRTTFKVTDKLIENVVLYLYRKRLYENPNYSDSKQFINRLVELLEPSSAKAMFIVLSQAFAKIFTFARFKVQYPFFLGYYPTVAEIEVLINSLNKQEVGSIDYKNLFEVTLMLKLLGWSQENLEQIKRYAFTSCQSVQKKNRLQHQLYTLILLKFIKEGLLQPAIQLADIILRIKTDNSTFNVIYPIFFLQMLQKDLLPRVRQPSLRLISHYFYSHRQVLQIVVQLTSGAKLSSEQIDALMAQKQIQKQHCLILDPNNIIFSPAFKSFIGQLQPSQQVATVNQMLETIWLQISTKRQQFKLQHIYNIIFRILLHDPFVLTQYIYRKQAGINVKSLRALFTLLGFEAVFDMSALFEVGRALFEALMTKLQSAMLLGDVLQNQRRSSRSNQELIYTEEYLSSQVKLTAQDLLGSSIMIMDQKLAFLQRNPAIEKNEARKHQQIKELVSRPEIYLKRKAEESQVILQRLYPNRKRNAQMELELLKKGEYPEYPFNDQDHSYTEAKYDLNLPATPYAPGATHFDQVAQRSQNREKLTYSKKLSIESEGTVEFDKLYHNKFLMKARRKNRGSELQKQSQTSNQKGQQFKMQDLFKLKCIQGGFLFMLDSSPRTKPDQTQHPSPLNIHKPIQEGPPDQSEILDEFKVDSESRLSKSLALYLEQDASFELGVLPRDLNATQTQLFLQTLVPQIYGQRESSFSRRVELIYLIKGHMTNGAVQKQPGYHVLKRACASQEAGNMLAALEDLLPDSIFLEDYDHQTLAQIVKEQAADYVVHEEDFPKVARFVGEIFCSDKLAEDVRVVFLLKLSRKYLKSSGEVRRHIKDEILFLAGTISQERMVECIGVHRSGKNADFLEVAHLLQTIMQLCNSSRNS